MILKASNKKQQAQNDSFLTAKIDGVIFYVDTPIYFSAQKAIERIPNTFNWYLKYRAK